jgi:Zn ribbon nucleic-acid-binding protein
MTCFCGCETYEKSEDGFKIACVKCNHGAQNHDDEYRESARKNESQSQKRDADFG